VINPNLVQEIQKQLLLWYRDHARDLPWRGTDNPYWIWISEIMLQQTRVDTVIPYYQRWIKSYPSLTDLAEAEEDQVLLSWEGLGYYTRARNLHRTARIIAEEYQGDFPQDPKELQSLPGIGRYTAGAIASIAFGEPAPILDGNVRRVFTRYFNISTPIQTKETEDLLWKITSDLIITDNPGEYNQALMELGALICLPKNPLCNDCPLEFGCQAKKLNLQNSRPVRKEKQPLPKLTATAAVIIENDRALLGKRPSQGMLGSMWEFPGGTQEGNESLPATLKRELREELNIEIKVGDLIGTFKHTYTHYKVTLHAYHCSIISGNLHLNFHTQHAWVPLESLEEFPMGKLDRMISKSLLDQ
jgi:A/G-specific adenine glycosylase